MYIFLFPRSIIYIFLFLLTFNSFSQTGFEKNTGQHDPEVKFKVLIPDVNMFFTKKGVTYSIFNKNTANSNLNLHKANNKLGHVLKWNFNNIDRNVSINGENTYNYPIYYISNNNRPVQTESYEKIIYKDAYDKTDICFKLSNNSLKTDFILQPGANPGSISYTIEGAEKLKIDTSGDLLIFTSAGILVDSRPVAYQVINNKNVEVKVEFQLGRNNEVHFKTGKYNPDFVLVIDPCVSYSTYIGGVGGVGAGEAMTVDEDGFAYIAGAAGFPDYPLTSGTLVFDPVGQQNNTVITKLSPDGQTIIFSSVITNTDYLYVSCMALDKNNNIYIAGENLITDGLFVMKVLSTGTSIVYTHTACGMDYGHQMARDITIDDFGNAYITGNYDWHRGCTPYFPAGVYSQQPLDGEFNSFILKLDPNGSVLVSTFLGNSWGYGITYDKDYNILVTGTAKSLFQTTSNAYDPVFNGPNIGSALDAFIIKLNPTATAVIFSTFLGGSAGEIAGATAYEMGTDIEISASDEIYVYGITPSADFPVSADAFDKTHNGSWTNFLVKFDPTGKKLLRSTFIGSSYPTYAGDRLNLDSIGIAYISGVTASSSFPVTADALQTTYGGGFDAFASIVSPDFKTLLFSTYLGGNGEERIGTSAISDNAFYISGVTNSHNYPVTANAYQNINKSPTHNNYYLTKFSRFHYPQIGLTGNCNPITANVAIDNTIDSLIWTFDDGFTSTDSITSYIFTTIGIHTIKLKTYSNGCVDSTTIIDIVTYPVPNASFSISEDSICKNENMIFTNTSLNATNFYWNLADETISNSGINVNKQYSSSGNKLVYLIASNSLFCKDSVSKEIFVDDFPSVTHEISDTICINNNLNIRILNDQNYTYEWNFGNGDGSNIIEPLYAYDTDGVYTVNVLVKSLLECTSSINETVVVLKQPFVDLGKDTSICNGSSIQLYAGTGSKYNWSTIEKTSYIVIYTPGIYWVDVTNTFCPSVRDSIIILENISAVHFIPNLVTPNEDNLNEYFEISNLPDNVMIEIYNRWGKPIYISNKYDNKWRGEDISGIYYYYIKIPDQCGKIKEYKGWVEIIK